MLPIIINKNEIVQPAILRFGEDKFMVVDVDKKVNVNKEQIWSYEKVEEIVMRARHQHMDIKFLSKGSNNRFRLCSSYLQGITNEFVIRAKPHIIRVTFEPGVRKFQYDSISFCKVPMTKSRTEVTGASAGVFHRRSNKVPNATQKLLKDAPDDVKIAVQQQEQDLDDISNIISDITSIAETMGNELDRQTEQLDRITGRVDLANEKVYQTNKRIDRLL